MITQRAWKTNNLNTDKTPDTIPLFKAVKREEENPENPQKR